MRYEIKELKDILEIPEDRLDDFIVDLKSWYTTARGFSELIKATGDVAGLEINSMVKSLTWIDDNKQDIRLIVEPSEV